MPLPEFNPAGDLPEGIHVASLGDVMGRFGAGGPERQAATAALARVHQLARATGKLNRFLLFGSYVTTKPKPKDVDIVLVMQDDFVVESCSGEAAQLFDHNKAQEYLGASVFWVRPSMLFLDTLDSFLCHWQVKRDQTRRGIVEVKG